MRLRVVLLVVWLAFGSSVFGNGVLGSSACGNDDIAVPPSCGWLAGVSKRIITPPQSMWMSGYASRSRPAEGKLTELWAKALMLRDAEGAQFVVVALDLIGIDRVLSQAICDEVHKVHGLSRGQIALVTSHTHSGPVVGDNLSCMYQAVWDETQRRLVSEYAQNLIKSVVEMVGEAKDNLRPAALSWGAGLATFAVNRRENNEAEVPSLRQQGKLRGPVDHAVPVLAVRDTQGTLRSLVFGYACHATVLGGYEWCGDYPGYAHQELEARHKDCVALFWAGCGADQNPLPRREVPLAQKYGELLANAVDAVLDAPMSPLAANLRATYREVDLPFDTLPTRESLESDAKSKDPYAAARAKMLLEQIENGIPLSPTYPYPVQTVRLGNAVQWTLLGGEVVVDYSLRLKEGDQGVVSWVAAYANDVMAYIPSRRVLTEGGYEGGGAMVYYGQPTVWAPVVEELIVKEAQRQRTE